jgi:hypothetical protein
VIRSVRVKHTFRSERARDSCGLTGKRERVQERDRNAFDDAWAPMNEVNDRLQELTYVLALVNCQ